MAQTLLTPTIITRKALMAFVNSLTFARGANRQYDNQFANSGASPSGKIGPTLTIRKPNRFQITSGAALQIQDVAEESTTMTVSSRIHVDFSFPTQDLTLTIDDFMDRYVNRAVETLANKVDLDGLALYKDIANTVGTAGTTPATPAVWLAAKQKLQEFAVPVSGKKYAVLNPAAEAATVNGLTNLFNSQKKIAEQYDTGEMGEALGLIYKMDQNVASHTCGTRPATGASVATTATSGTATLAVTSSGASDIFNDGDTFTCANVYAVNPQGKQSTGSLQQFVVTADATASGSAVTLSIYPTPITSGAKKNINRLPTQSDVITFTGDTTAVVPQNLVFHQDAFTLVTADLEIPQGVHFAARENYEGISLRIVRQYSIDSDQIPCRIDVLYGWKTLYPEWACRVIG